MTQDEWCCSCGAGNDAKGYAHLATCMLQRALRAEALARTANADWLVKDFHALYLAADTAAAALLKVPRAAEARAALMVQLTRLRTAFEVCEFERQAGTPQRLTEPERKALNALHRWLHSPAGDDGLIEGAQDYHEQVELECGVAECDRIQEEELIAWGTLKREMAMPTGVCRVCGCTDDDCSQCVEKTGMACHWVEPDLCSACEVPR